MTSKSNQETLDWIESIGGGYVWEDEIFSVNIEDYPLSVAEARTVAALDGVQQIAVLGVELEEPVLDVLAGIDGLESLVLTESLYTRSFVVDIRDQYPEIEILFE